MTEGKENKSAIAWNIETGKEIPCRVIAGGECPKCGNFGIFNLDNYCICESCLTRWDKDPRQFVDAKEIK